jgi:hypothetical protein
VKKKKKKQRIILFNCNHMQVISSIHICIKFCVISNTNYAITYKYKRMSIYTIIRQVMTLLSVYKRYVIDKHTLLQVI